MRHWPAVNFRLLPDDVLLEFFDFYEDMDYSFKQQMEK